MLRPVSHDWREYVFRLEVACKPRLKIVGRRACALHYMPRAIELIKPEVSGKLYEPDVLIEAARTKSLILS